MTIFRALSSPYDLDETEGGYFHDTPVAVSPHCQDHITLRNGPNVAGVRIPKTRNLWLGFELAKNDQSATPTDGFVELFDTAYSTTQPLFRIRKATSNAATARMWVWTGTAWVDSGVNGGTWGAGTLMRLDIELVMDDTNGIWRTYRNGVDTIAYLGDTDRVASDGIDLIRFGTYSTASNQESRMTTYSGILIADEDTRGKFVAQRKPTGAGDFVQWTGDYEDVTSSAYNGLPGDATFITTAAEDRRESFTYASLEEYQYNPILAVGIAHRGRESDAGYAPITGFIRSGGVNYDGAPIASGTSFRGTQTMLEDDGSDPWTYEALEGAQFGVKSVAP